MSLLICPECKGKVSSSASVCPHCGYDMESTRLLQQQQQPAAHHSTAVSPGMIGLIIALSLLLGGLLFMLFTRNDTDKKHTASEETVESTTNNTATPPRIGISTVSFTGTLGGDHSAWLRLDGQHGSYKFTSYERNVRIKSYDPSSGKLQLEAVNNNNGYVGTFSGTLRSDGDRWVYAGTFTNLNNISIDFRFTAR